MIVGNKNKQPWLHNAAFDLIFFLSPALLALFVTFLLPTEYKTTEKIPLSAWVILILMIDVAHVYSTLFRTYWDKQRLAKHKTLYVLIPLVCYIVGVLLYAIDGLLFWRILAYLAVFHFIRQQYGFMRLYSRFQVQNKTERIIDSTAIYAATLYPLLYWHCTPGRNFNWFIDGDFLIFNSHLLRNIGLICYCTIIVIYIIKETIQLSRFRTFNLPKNLLLLTTLLSWYFGIIYFNGDMAFTLLNVVAHGIPYIALIWLFRQKEAGRAVKPSLSFRLPQYTLVFFLMSIFLFAYLEEGLWDGMVWREHPQIFSMFNFLPMIRTKETLALLVPLLSLPQSTHYVLDGFIWKRNNN